MVIKIRFTGHLRSTSFCIVKWWSLWIRVISKSCSANQFWPMISLVNRDSTLFWPEEAFKFSICCEFTLFLDKKSRNLCFSTLLIEKLLRHCKISTLDVGRGRKQDKNLHVDKLVRAPRRSGWPGGYEETHLRHWTVSSSMWAEARQARTL